MRGSDSQNSGHAYYYFFLCRKWQTGGLLKIGKTERVFMICDEFAWFVGHADSALLMRSVRMKIDVEGILEDFLIQGDAAR